MVETTADPSCGWLGTMPILNLLTVFPGLRGAPEPTVGMSAMPEVAIGKLEEEFKGGISVVAVAFRVVGITAADDVIHPAATEAVAHNPVWTS